MKRTLSFLGSTVAAAASSTAEGGISTTHKFEQLLGGGGGGQSRYKSRQISTVTVARMSHRQQLI